MSVIALQIGPDGYSWCRMPETVHMEGETPLEVHGHSWPTEPWLWAGGVMPPDLDRRLLSHHIILALTDDADEVVYAVEPDMDMRLAGAIDIAVANSGWSPVTVVEPHPDGAAGIMREVIREMIRNADPVSEEDRC